jgi:hypothetical protein
MDTKFTEQGKPHLSRPRRLSIGVLRHACQGAQRLMWLRPTFVPGLTTATITNYPASTGERGR